MSPTQQLVKQLKRYRAIEQAQKLTLSQQRLRWSQTETLKQQAKLQLELTEQQLEQQALAAENINWLMPELMLGHSQYFQQQQQQKKRQQQELRRLEHQQQKNIEQLAQTQKNQRTLAEKQAVAKQQIQHLQQKQQDQILAELHLAGKRG